jgi:hypothetical protein
VPRPRLSEYEYLRQLELLATDIVNHAQHEGWLSTYPTPPTPPLFNGPSTS